MKILLKDKIQKCEYCSAEFTYKEEKRFCRKECYHESLKKDDCKETIKCITCNKEFIFYKYKNRSFCSNECAKQKCHLLKKKKPKRTHKNCEICGDSFKFKHRSQSRCPKHYNKRICITNKNKYIRVSRNKTAKNCIYCGSVYISKNEYFCSKKCSLLNMNITINDFSELNNISSYFAGFLFGDGHIDHRNKRVSISLSQKYYTNYLILEQLSNYVFGENKITIRDNSYHYSLSFGSNEIINNLQRFGMQHNQKSLYDTLILPQYHTKDFIRGYFDADGWASIRLQKHKNGKLYLSKNVGLCSYREDNIIKVNEYIGLNTNIAKKRNQEMYELRFYSYNDIKHFYNLINGYPRLEHKWTKLDFLNHLTT